MCRAVGADPDPDPDPVYSGEDDAPSRMVGDVNLFLTPCDDEDDEDGESEDIHGNENERRDAGRESGLCDLQGEIDIMIASRENRRKGLGEAAVRAFLQYLSRNHEAIVDEYVRGASPAAVGDAPGVTKTKTKTTITTEEEEEEEKRNGAGLKRLVAKINADNAGSIRLFGNLGFRQHGGPNYFNEISMALVDFPSMPPSMTTTAAAMVPGTSLGTAESGTKSGITGSEVEELGYRERLFDRSRLKK